MPTHAPATHLPAPKKAAVPAHIRAAVEQGWLDYMWRFGTRAWLSLREAAAALGRVSDAAIANTDFVIKLIEAGEIAALRTPSFDGRAEDASRSAWRVDATSVRFFIARNYTLPPDAMMGRSFDYLRNIPAPELRRLAASALAMAETKEARA